MYFIFENNNYRTNAKGNRLQIARTTKYFDKLSNQQYTAVANCFETQEVDCKKYKLTLDGKDLLTVKKGRVRTTKETNKNYVKLAEKYTLVKMPNTHVTVLDKNTNQLMINRQGKTSFKIGSPTLNRLLLKNVLIAPQPVAAPIVEPIEVVEQVVPIAAPIVEPIEVVEQVAAPNPFIEPAVIEAATVVADQKEQPTFEEISLSTDRDKLKRIVKECYIAFRQGHDIIKYKMRCQPNNDIKFYSLQIYPLLENGKWNMQKATKRLNYFIQYPSYYKNQWSHRDAEQYADRKVIGSRDDYWSSDEFYGAELIEAMELDFGRDIPDWEGWDESFFDEYFADEDEKDLGLGNLFESQEDAWIDLGPSDFQSLDEYFDYFDQEYGCTNELDMKPDLKNRTMNVMKQINVEKVGNNCFREALDHYGLESKIVGLVSINDVLNELERLNINYIIYNAMLPALRLDYIKSHLGEKRMMLPQSTKAGAKPVLHREIIITPEVEYSCDTKEGKTYIFALYSQQQRARLSHIYVPQQIELYTNGSQNSIYQIAEFRGHRYMKKLTSTANKRKANYIYYDIETYESTDERKFKCNSVSVLSYKCALDLYKSEEAPLIEMLRSQNNSFCYLQRGVHDSQENVDRYNSRNLIIVDEINLWNILESYMDPDAMNYIVSFNGACFDNLFLLKSMIDNKILVQASICGGLIELNNDPVSSVAPFKTLDIRRLLGGVGSLEGHSRSFIKDVTMRKVANKKLFKIINEKYRQGIVLDDDSFIQEFIGYNNLDVESLLLIHAGMLRALTYITKDEQVEAKLTGCVSLAQFSMIIFKTGIKNMRPNNKPQKFPNAGKMEGLTEEEQRLQYDLFRTYKTGGRCQAQKTEVIESKFDMVSLDVASLYPFVMMCYNKGIYMAGKLKPTNVYVEGKPGIYFGSVTQVNNGNNEMGFFCYKSMIANDWNYFNQENKRVVMTSHDIEEILKKKRHWRFTIDFGYYTENSARGFDIFTSILPFMKEKAHQDLLAINKDEKANTAIREMCKSVMNSLSGKFLQSVKEIERYVLPYELDGMLNESGNTIGINRKERLDFLNESLKKDKMLHVGLFIYSLSKIYMYQNAYSITNENNETIIGKQEFVYTDTDSNKIVRQEVFDKWMEMRGARTMVDQVWPELLTMNLGYDTNTTYFYNGTPGTIKCMGQFEDEYKNKGYNNAIYLNKKEYMVWKTNSEGIITNSCIKLKGVQCTKLKILNKEDKDIGRHSSEGKLISINYVIGRNEYLGIEEGYSTPAHYNGQWHCEINKDIYKGEEKWWNENNRMTEEIEAIEREKAEDHDGYVKKFIYIMQRKWRGQKTLVLIKNFKRDLDTQTVRNTFMIKRI